MTLLEFFINDCDQGYIEPERKGVTKGHEIGMFRGRYNAALQMMYNYTKQEVALKSNNTYPFIRKLCVDDNFTMQRAIMLDLFTENYLYPYLTDGYIVKSDARGVTYPGCTIFDGNKVRLPYNTEELFADVDRYAPELKRMIANDIAKYLDKMGIQRWLGSHERLACLLSRWHEPELNRQIFSSAFALGEELIRKTLDFLNTPEAMRADAISCCRFLRSIAATI